MSSEMDREVAAYFSSLSFPVRKITKEVHDLEFYLGDRLDSLSPGSKDELIDYWFVDKDTRQKYKQTNVNEYPCSFPKLMVPSGEKIMVDETDLRTWKDAHSGPFSWKSKSQQDLSLDDFEPDVIGKPPLKGKKTKEVSDQDQMASPEFIYKDETWTDAMLAEVRNYLDKEIVRSRSTSPLEEVNEAFEGSVQNLASSTCQSQKDIVSQSSLENTESTTINEFALQSVQKSKILKSPVKIAKSKSFNKNDNIDTTPVLTKDNDDSKQAFSNPAVVTEWSTFVGQESHVQKSAASYVTNEPPNLSMDRGNSHESHSSESSPDHASHLIASDHSTETSPDHTTHLLDHGKISEAEKEEILTVTVTNTESESNLPRTGFDFLDNW